MTLVFPLLDSEGVLVSSSRRETDERRGIEQAEARAPASKRGLTITHGGTRNVLEQIGSGTYHLGRGKACEIRIQSSYASRFHARIEFRDGVPYLVDDSKNGTFIRFEGGRLHYLVKREIELKGSGIFSLGTAIENNVQWRIRFHYE